VNMKKWRSAANITRIVLLLSRDSATFRVFLLELNRDCIQSPAAPMGMRSTTTAHENDRESKDGMQDPISLLWQRDTSVKRRSGSLARP